jgi:hypothetical protein
MKIDSAVRMRSGKRCKAMGLLRLANVVQVQDAEMAVAWQTTFGAEKRRRVFQLV